MARKPDSKAVAEACAKVNSILRDFRDLKDRLRATVERLKEAAPTAPVVDTHPDGTTYALEDWMAGEILTAVDGDEFEEVLQGLHQATNVKHLRETIREWCEFDRLVGAVNRRERAKAYARLPD